MYNRKDELRELKTFIELGEIAPALGKLDRLIDQEDSEGHNGTVILLLLIIMLFVAFGGLMLSFTAIGYQIGTVC